MNEESTPLPHDEIKGYLRKVPLFSEAIAPYIDDLVPLCRVRTFRPGETLFKQGDKESGVHIVIGGKVIVERELWVQEDSVSIMIAKPVDTLGEMSLFFDAPRSVTATAMQKTTTLWIDAHDFKPFALQRPALLVEVCKLLSQRLAEAYEIITTATRDRKPRELRSLYDKLDF